MAHNLASNFNVSLPYMQIKNIVLRNSKFGRALVIETLQRGRWVYTWISSRPARALGAYRARNACIIQTYGATPIFGVEFSFEEDPPDLTKTMLTRVEEDVEVVEDALDNHAVSAYFAEEEDALEEADDGEPDEERLPRDDESAKEIKCLYLIRILGLPSRRSSNSDIASLWRIM